MKNASTGMLKQGTQTPSPAPDLIPAEAEVNRELSLQLVQRMGARQSGGPHSSASLLSVTP